VEGGGYLDHDGTPIFVEFIALAAKDMEEKTRYAPWRL
jgi:hypothetical protein